MTQIHARTQDQVLVATILPKLACNGKKVVKLHVEFDATWDDFPARQAIFTTSNDPTPYPAPLSSTGDCTVPAEVLADDGYLFITIEGLNPSTGARKPTTPIKYKVLPGTPSLLISDPSESVYQRLMSAYGEAARELAVERARINNIAALKEGSTTGDAELADIRVDYAGATHGTAGDAVRSQGEMLFKGLTSDSVVDCLKIRRTYYYLGTAAIDTNAVDNCKMRSKLVDLAAFQAAFAAYGTAGGGATAFVGELNSPLPVSTDFSKYTLVINTDVATSFSIRFSSGLSWAANQTVKGVYTNLTKGINVIPLDILTNATDNGHAFYNFVSIQTTALLSATQFDAYIVADSALIDYFTDKIEALRRDLVYVDLDGTPEKYTHSLECNVSYADSLLSINIPARTTTEAEWRFAIVSFNLGKDLAGRKLLVRRNTNNMKSFGIGVSTSRWAEKSFPTDHDIHEIDLAEFIADNPTLANNTGNYYLVVGIETANTATYTREFNESINVMEITGASSSLSPIARLAEFDPDKVEMKTDKYITCWGDSLTSGAGWTERLAALSGLPVYNAGTGGENVRSITARQGADVIMINNITIPAAVEPVTLATYANPFTTAFGYNATPLLQGGSSHVNPVKIGGVEGTLKWTGSSYNDTAGTWTFTRSEAGEAVTIDRPTALVTAFDREKNAPHLMVVFMGQNGGYSDIDDLINLHRLMKDHAKAKHTIILGLSSGSAESRADYEAAMKKAFGRYFISLREYLSQYGLADAGLTPTAADETAMASGTVPPQLLTDAVHYTSATKTVIGNLIYKRADELGVWSEMAESAGAAEYNGAITVT